MAIPHEPEDLRYEDRLRAREIASRRAWTDEQKRRVVDAGVRARAQRRHEWREVDPSAVDPRVPRERQGEAARASPAALFALESVGAGLGAAHLVLGVAGALFFSGFPIVVGPWMGALMLAFVVGFTAVWAASPAWRRARIGGPVERLVIGIVAGVAAGLLAPTVSTLSAILA